MRQFEANEAQEPYCRGSVNTGPVEAASRSIDEVGTLGCEIAYFANCGNLCGKIRRCAAYYVPLCEQYSCITMFVGYILGNPSRVEGDPRA
jgi:hypothetical protein